MKLVACLLLGLGVGFLAGTLWRAPVLHADTAAGITRAINGLVDTLADSDPTFRERFLKKLEATDK